MSLGERGPLSSRHGKDKARVSTGEVGKGEYILTSHAGRSQELLSWPADEALQTLLPGSPGATGAHTSLPRPPSPPRLCSRPPPPTALWVSGTFDTPPTFLGGPQDSPSSFLTYVTPSPVLSPPCHLHQTLILPWCPCSRLLKVPSSSSTAQSVSDITLEKSWSQQWAPAENHVSCSTAACSRSFYADISSCNPPKGITRLHNTQCSCTYRPKASQQDKSFSLLNLPHR